MQGHDVTRKFFGQPGKTFGGQWPPGTPLAPTLPVAQPEILFGRSQPLDVRPTVRSVYLQAIEINIKHQGKILASLFRGRPWPLRHHSGCATGLYP